MGARTQSHAAEHRAAVDGLVSFADARLADMQALYLVVEQRLAGMSATQECALLPTPPLCPLLHAQGSQPRVCACAVRVSVRARVCVLLQAPLRLSLALRAAPWTMRCGRCGGGTCS